MVTVKILQNGPAIIEDDSDYLYVQSPLPPVPEYTKKVAICRCGKSENGIWCDGSHSKKETKKE